MVLWLLKKTSNQPLVMGGRAGQQTDIILDKSIPYLAFKSVNASNGEFSTNVLKQYYWVAENMQQLEICAGKENVEFINNRLIPWNSTHFPSEYVLIMFNYHEACNVCCYFVSLSHNCWLYPQELDVDLFSLLVYPLRILPQNALKRDRNSKCIDLIEGHYLEVVVLL